MGPDLCFEKQTDWWLSCLIDSYEFTLNKPLVLRKLFWHKRGMRNSCNYCHIASPLSTSVLCAIANDQQARLYVHSIKPSDSVQSLAYSTGGISRAPWWPSPLPNSHGSECPKITAQIYRGICGIFLYLEPLLLSQKSSLFPAKLLCKLHQRVHTGFLGKPSRESRESPTFNLDLAENQGREKNISAHIFLIFHFNSIENDLKTIKRGINGKR